MTNNVWIGPITTYYKENWDYVVWVCTFNWKWIVCMNDCCYYYSLKNMYLKKTHEKTSHFLSLSFLLDGGLLVRSTSFPSVDQGLYIILIQNLKRKYLYSCKKPEFELQFEILNPIWNFQVVLLTMRYGMRVTFLTH